MKKHVILEYDIEYCNSRCPHFYHNFEDQENRWCDKLKKKVADQEDDDFMIWGDMNKYPIPKECPLEDTIEEKK